MAASRIFCELVDGVPTSYHVEYYARAVEAAAVRRALIVAGGRIAALGYDEAQATEPGEWLTRSHSYGRSA